MQSATERHRCYVGSDTRLSKLKKDNRTTSSIDGDDDMTRPLLCKSRSVSTAAATYISDKSAISTINEGIPSRFALILTSRQVTTHTISRVVLRTLAIERESIRTAPVYFYW